MKRSASFFLIIAICTFCNYGNAQISADDFLPPLGAKTPAEQNALKEVKGPVKEQTDSVTGQPVVQADTAQDAINTVLAKRTAGTEMIRFGSGIGWVATGVASYEVLANPTATRISRRNAYVRAFMDAKSRLAVSLNGLPSKGRDLIAEQLETQTTVAEDLVNVATTQEEKLEQSVRMLMRGFVIYSVEDDAKNNNVYVTIVTTPKTRGQFNRPAANAIEADSVRTGLNQVLAEVQSGLVPPVGGRIIQVPQTGEIAFVGFGSDVVRTNDNAALQAKLRLNADKVAQMRAADALVGLLIGDDTSWKRQLDESTKAVINQFETDAAPADPSLQRFQQQTEAFRNTQMTTEEYQSIRQGVLPPGVTRRSFASKDEGEMYAIAVYIPSYSAAAVQAAKEMAQANPLSQPPASSGISEQVSVPRPSKDIQSGPSGQVARDSDL